MCMATKRIKEKLVKLMLNIKSIKLMITFNLQGAGDEMVKPVKVKTVFNKVNSNDYGQAKFTGNLTDFFFNRSEARAM